MKEDASKTIYIKANKNNMVSHRRVTLADVTKLYGTDKRLLQNLYSEVLLQIPKENGASHYEYSVLKLMELMNRQHTELLFENIGETDFVVEYRPPKKAKQAWEILKAVFVCLAVFFGSAFAIMTFNQDVSVGELFGLVKELVLGDGQAGGYLLEISYSVGLTLGIVLFFNHFSRAKIDSDPTPLQIQMRLYEENLNQAMIENADREGKKVDVS